MKTVNVCLCRLICEEKIVAVEVPDNFDYENSELSSIIVDLVYQEDDGEGFQTDDNWGAEEGTHQFMSQTTDIPKFRAIFDDFGNFDEVQKVN